MKKLIILTMCLFSPFVLSEEYKMLFEVAEKPFVVAETPEPEPEPEPEPTPPPHTCEYHYGSSGSKYIGLGYSQAGKYTGFYNQNDKVIPAETVLPTIDNPYYDGSYYARYWFAGEQIIGGPYGFTEANGIYEICWLH